MQISQKELSAKGVSLLNGRYSTKVVGGNLEIYKHGGDTEGCILVGTGRAKEGVSNSRLAMSVLMPLLEEGMKNNVITIEVR
jgi:hypothetical protein